MLPMAANHLGLCRDRVELLSQFDNRLADEFVRDGAAVVKP
jgi:hypothetical protein